MFAKSAEAGGSAGEVCEFDVSLDFKLPEVQEEAFAVAEAAAAAESSGEGVVMKATVAAKRQWSCNGVESVDRYWGMSRLSIVELSKRQAQHESSTVRFNMEVLETQCANVIVGCQARSMTFTVVALAFTQTVVLRDGEQ